MPVEMHPYRSILFDLDGTLTDPKIGITRSVQYALGKLGIVVDDPGLLTGYIGPPLRASFKERHGLSEDEATLAMRHYRERYERAGMLENTAYDGVLELLERLGGSGRKLFLATSKPRVYAERILRHFRMDRFFESIEGSEMDETRSDKGELIAWLLEKHRLPRESTVMIGDRMHDIVGAGSNGLRSIGVGYGYGSREELRAARPTHYFDSLRELEDFLLGTPVERA